MEDTIAAISTPAGIGGIAIVRISGQQAFPLADRIFRCSRGKPSEFPSHTLHFGKIYREHEVLDEVVLAVFRAPHSYTGEDTVEIHCHGGHFIAQSILKLSLENGARLAQPGEFTKRAFLNGRMDLAQAEAVIDLISAQTERARKVALRTLEGSLSKKLQELADRLSNILAEVEAFLEFPEDEIPPPTQDQIQTQLRHALNLLDTMISTAESGRILREGLRVAIVGRPNVGKSSVMNALLGRQRSIVTSIPGTTRDFVEDFLVIDGIPVRLIDTAGYREPRGKVETEGIARTIEVLKQADVVIHVLDISRPLSKWDTHIHELSQHKATIQVLNKTDLAHRLRLPTTFSSALRIFTSAVTGEGIQELLATIGRYAPLVDKTALATEFAVNARQADALKRARSFLQPICELQPAQLWELIAENIRHAICAIAEVNGTAVTEEILDRIFERFCIGK